MLNVQVQNNHHECLHYMLPTWINNNDGSENGERSIKDGMKKVGEKEKDILKN